MTGKRILGYIFIALAILMILAIIGQLSRLFTSLIDFFQIFTGNLNSYQTGEALGHFIYWIIHFAITILLIIYGRKWTRKQKA